MNHTLLSQFGLNHHSQHPQQWLETIQVTGHTCKVSCLTVVSTINMKVHDQNKGSSFKVGIVKSLLTTKLVIPKSVKFSNRFKPQNKQENSLFFHLLQLNCTQGWHVLTLQCFWFTHGTSPRMDVSISLIFHYLLPRSQCGASPGQVPDLVSWSPAVIWQLILQQHHSPLHLHCCTRRHLQLTFVHKTNINLIFTFCCEIWFKLGI